VTVAFFHYSFQHPIRVTRYGCVKFVPKCSRNPFLSKYLYNLQRGKSSPKMYATLRKFWKKLPQVNSHPMGEKSPNLVTLYHHALFLTGKGWLAEVKVAHSRLGADGRGLKIWTKKEWMASSWSFHTTLFNFIRLY
jgi:hypothetical protein